MLVVFVLPLPAQLTTVRRNPRRISRHCLTCHVLSIPLSMPCRTHPLQLPSFGTITPSRSTSHQLSCIMNVYSPEALLVIIPNAACPSFSIYPPPPLSAPPPTASITSLPMFFFNPRRLDTFCPICVLVEATQIDSILEPHPVP